MSILNQISAQSPVRSGHKGVVNSGNVNPLLNEEFSSEVKGIFREKSIAENFFNFETISGTDVLTHRRMGGTDIQKVTRGVVPSDSAVIFDSISIKIDTLVLSRNTMAKIDEFLNNIDVRSKIAADQGKKHSDFKDKTLFNVAAKAAQVSAKVADKDADGLPTGTYTLVDGWVGNTSTNYVVKSQQCPDGWRGATSIELANAGDENDADVLERAIRDLVVDMEEKYVDVSELTIFMRPASYNILLDSEKLINTDYSVGNGDYAKHNVKLVAGLPVIKTTNLPKDADVGVEHLLSNAGNEFAYNVNQGDANVVALVLHKDSLLCGNLCPITSKIHYSDIYLQWFIDTYCSFACTPYDPRVSGGVFKADV